MKLSDLLLNVLTYTICYKLSEMKGKTRQTSIITCALGSERSRRALLKKKAIHFLLVGSVHINRSS
jgi:hypothetical protein